MRKYEIIVRTVTYGHVEVEAENMIDAIDAALCSPQVDWEDPLPSMPFEVKLVAENR
jgi:hypothetical protein